MPTIRPVRAEDIPELGRICFEAFGRLHERHAVEPDFDTVDTATMVIGMCASQPDFAGFVAEDGGRVVGSNFLCFSDAGAPGMPEGVAGVGPITVSPTAQAGGVGRALMLAVMDEARRRGIARVRLLQESINTASLSLYTKLGFEWREAVALMRPAPGKRDEPGVTPASPSDLGEIGELSARLYGSSRRNEAAGYLDMGMPGFVLRRGDLVRGYYFPGLFGHGFAETAEDLALLVRHASRHAPPMFQKVLVPLGQHDLHQQLMADGCRSVKVFNYMTTGPYQRPGGAWAPSIGM